MFYIWDKTLGCVHSEYNDRSTAEIALSSLVHNFLRAPHEVYVKERPESEAYEHARLLFEDGTWVAPVWKDTDFYQEVYQYSPYFVRVDEDEPEFVRYFPSEEKLLRGQSTKIKPGKFLKQVYGDILSSDDITAWVDEHKLQWLGPDELSFARTPEEITQVYSMDSTFKSCMQHSRTLNGNWTETGWDETMYMHPTGAYGAGDLAVAYLHKGGRLIARAVVNQENKTVGRMYGDIVSLVSALSAQKYDTKRTDFEGARLLKLPFEENEENRRYDKNTKVYIGPYVDGEYSYAIHDPEDDNYLKLIHYGDKDKYLDSGTEVIFLQNASGLATSRRKCTKCHKHSFKLYNVGVGIVECEIVYENYCSSCTNDVSYSEISGNYFDSSKFEIVDVITSGGRRYKGAKGLDPILYSEFERCYLRITDTVYLADGRVANRGMEGVSYFRSNIDGLFYPMDERRSMKIGGLHVVFANEQAGKVAEIVDQYGGDFTAYSIERPIPVNPTLLNVQGYIL